MMEYAMKPFAKVAKKKNVKMQLFPIMFLYYVIDNP